MIHVFMLVVFFQGAEQRASSMLFYDIDRCLYFAERMNKLKLSKLHEYKRLMNLFPK